MMDNFSEVPSSRRIHVISDYLGVAMHASHVFEIHAHRAPEPGPDPVEEPVPPPSPVKDPVPDRNPSAAA